MIHPDHSKSKLNDLFDQLKTLHEEQKIQEDGRNKSGPIWLNSEDPQTNILMEQGYKAMAQGNYTAAIETFSHLVKANPSYAEGWNKRATAYYLRGDYKASLEDIRCTLKLEGRHFGALYGLASIYMAIGYYKGALAAFEKLAAIYPQREDIHSTIYSLHRKVNKSEN
ncbi:MAG: tetratricopeptide repeat protein [Bacteroidia bacterium]|nr:tetratricopeptide repeat protein [Bacteroidia bacterium]